MNKTKLRLSLLLLLGSIALGSCSRSGGNEFTAEGTITDAAGKTLSSRRPTPTNLSSSTP